MFWMKVLPALTLVALVVAAEFRVKSEFRSCGERVVVESPEYRAGPGVYVIGY
jgi:hypothetical protein